MARSPLSTRDDLNSVGAVVNEAGEVLRVVVTPLSHMHYHVDPKRGESLVIMPDVLLSPDPLPLEEGMLMVEWVKRHVKKMRET